VARPSAVTSVCVWRQLRPVDVDLVLSCEGAICTANAGDLAQRMMCGYAACALTMTVRPIM